MPRSTPIASPELAPNGNSGNTAKSAKLSNAIASEIHDPAGGKPIGNITQNSVTTSGTISVESTGVTEVGLTQDLNNPFSNDGYRNPSGGSLYSRELDEAEDKIARISVRGVSNQKDLISGYGNFFLQAVSEADNEKYQVVETFSSFYAFFFGRRPPIYTFSGMLLNDPKQNWMNTFRYMYENYFRGTSLADLDSEAVITYDKRIVTGYLLNLNIQQDAISDKGVPFSFSVLVVRHDTVGWSSDFEAFIQKEQDSLKKLRADVRSRIASINANPDGIKTILAMHVLQGQKPASDATKTDAKDDTSPPSNQKQLPEIAAAEAVKQVSVTDNYLATANATALKTKK